MIVNQSPSRSGFTLVEVMVGLVIASILALTIHSLATQVTRATRAGSLAQGAMDRESNRRRWLTAAFLSSETGPETGPFDGKPDRLRFDSWLQQPGGWFARKEVVLAASNGSLIALIASGDSVRLADSMQAAFSYLLRQDGGSRWVGEWHSSTHAPPAIRLVIRSQNASQEDTLLFLLKERG